MIKTTAVPNSRHANVKFKEHELAHFYLDAKTGIEIGPAAHNPFGLTGSISVGLGPDMDINDYRFFQRAQVDMCGEYSEIEVSGEAHDIPLPDNSQDYVLTSHVIEHLPNPIAALVEWDRLLKEEGIIFSILPLRDALAADRQRDITPIETIILAFADAWTVDTVPFWHEKTVPGGRRGHYFVWTPETFQQLIRYCNQNGILNWEITHVEEIDTKVGNGFTVVYKKAKADPAKKD